MEERVRGLCGDTYTLSELDRRVGLLRAALEAVLYTKTAPASEESFKDAVYKEACVLGAKEDADVLLDAWYESVWKGIRSQQLKRFLNELEKDAHAIVRFDLYVPVELSKEALAELISWYRTEVHFETVFILHVDRAVVGGCGFVMNDTYQENSLRRKLETQKGFITNLIASYV